MENKGHLKHLAQINKMRMIFCVCVFWQPIFGILSSCRLSANRGVVTNRLSGRTFFIHVSFIHFWKTNNQLWFNGQFLWCANTVDKQNTSKKKQESSVGLCGANFYNVTSIPSRFYPEIHQAGFINSSNIMWISCCNLAKVGKCTGYMQIHRNILLGSTKDMSAWTSLIKTLHWNRNECINTTYHQGQQDW